MVIPASGLVGRYDGSSWNSTQWTDLSGAGNHATIVRGSIKVSEAGFRGVPYIYGTTEDGIRFPAAILPATYTLFHVTKYNGASKARIFDGWTTNWLSGFHGGMAGKAYHNNWITPQVDVHGSNWVFSTDQNALYRSNKVNRTIAASGTPSYDQISINYGIYYTVEPSDWACAEVIVYNRTLSAAEIDQVEADLYARYGPPGLAYGVSTRQNQAVDALRDGAVTRPSHAFLLSSGSGMWRQTTGELALSARSGVGIGIVRPLTLAANSVAANVFVGSLQYAGLVASDIVQGTFDQATYPTVFGTSTKSFTGNSIAFGGVQMTVDSGASVNVPLPWILDATVPTVPIQPLLSADMYGMTTEFVPDYVNFRPPSWGGFVPVWSESERPINPRILSNELVDQYMEMCGGFFVTQYDRRVWTIASGFVFAGYVTFNEIKNNDCIFDLLEETTTAYDGTPVPLSTSYMTLYRAGTSQNLSLTLRNNGTTVTTTSTTSPLVTGKYQIIACRIASGAMSIYVDGIIVATTSVSVVDFVIPSIVTLAYSLYTTGSGATAFMNLREVLFYNSAVDVPTITAYLYSKWNALYFRPRERSLAISTFKATTGTDVTVSSINGKVVKSRRGWDPPNFLRLDILRHLQSSRDNSAPHSSMDAIYDGPGTDGGYAGGVLLADGRVFMVPMTAPTALIYDPVSRTTSTPAGVYGSFLGGVLMADGRVFMIPGVGGSSYAAVYDPNTNTLLNIPRSFEEYDFAGATLLPNGRVFCVPYNSTMAVLFDPTSNTFSDSSVEFPGDYAFFGSVLLPDGRVFMVPENEASAWVYDPAGDSVQVCDFPEGGYNGGVLLPDGRVFCVPYTATHAAIYDPLTDTTIVSTAEYPGSFVGGVLLPDGRVFCIPYESTRAVVYDPIKDVTTMPRGTFEPYDVYGGVLTPQGHVVCVPFNAANIKIAHCGTGDVPLSIATSPFLNNAI